MQIQSLGREDPLEMEIATHSSILAWRIPWTEEPGGLQFTGSQKVGHDLVTKQQYDYPHNSISILFIFFLSTLSKFTLVCLISSLKPISFSNACATI